MTLRRLTHRLVLALVLTLAAVSWAIAGPRSIEVFVGSASKPAIQEVARRFTEQTGIEVLLHLGGSGAMLSQIQLAQRGDIYFPGSSDFMARAIGLGLVEPQSEVRVAYLVPAINVVAGNPLKIRSLRDLARPGVRVGIARPETVCVGLYAVEILEDSGLAKEVRQNVVNTAESCASTAQMLSLGLVDAVLGWDVFDDWDPRHIDTVPYAPEQIERIGYLPAALARFVRDRDAAQAFLDTLTSAEAQAIFRRHGYLTTLAEARGLALPDTPVGGVFPLPEEWR
jgi:molybdate transport system substrate-binding protein